MFPQSNDFRSLLLFRIYFDARMGAVAKQIDWGSSELHQSLNSPVCFVRLNHVARCDGSRLGDEATVAAATGAFRFVEVLPSTFFDRLCIFADFFRWVVVRTTVVLFAVSMIFSSYGAGRLRASGPPPVMTPALPSPRPLPAVLPVVPVPVICPLALLQIKDPAQTPTKAIRESLDMFIVAFLVK
jgi:hypothetical protein